MQPCSVGNMMEINMISLGVSLLQELQLQQHQPQPPGAISCGCSYTQNSKQEEPDIAIAIN